MAGIAVIGHLTRDLVDSRPPRPGGVVFHAARALRALGERATVVARCAPEDEALLRPLRALGLPVVWRPERTSAVFRIRNRDGERELAIESLGAPWTRADARGWLRDALAGADWLIAGALWRGDFPASALAELAGGRSLVLDAQGLLRPARVGPVVLAGDLDRSLLAHVSLLHLSEVEAGALGLELDERSLRSLGVPEVVVTLGAAGAVVYADDLAELVPARPLRGVDPTGAGDAFTAAYAASRRRGHAPASAARRATEVVHGLLSVRRRR